MPGACGGGVGSVLSESLPPARDEAEFPFGSGERHTRSVPFARALGVRWHGLYGDAAAPTARMCLPYQAAVADDQGAIDRRAIAALLDHAGAPACYGAGVSKGATATLELRIDFIGEPVPGSDLEVHTRCIASDSATALVVGEACHDGGSAIARMTGRYVVGLGPGRANDSSERPEHRAANAARHAAAAAPAVSSFDGLLGGHVEGEAFELGFSPWLVGSVALPALHGGVVAAGLMSAARLQGGPRLVSLNLLFLRAALAVDTCFTARCLKRGGRAVYVAADAAQHGGERQVATLQALYA